MVSSPPAHSTARYHDRPRPQRRQRLPTRDHQPSGPDRQRRDQGMRHRGTEDERRLPRARLHLERRQAPQATAERAPAPRSSSPAKDDTGVGPCIDKRAQIGNRVHSDAAVSIHADGGPSSGRGFHVIYSTKINGLTDDIYRPSKKLAIPTARRVRERHRPPRVDLHRSRTASTNARISAASASPTSPRSSSRPATCCNATDAAQVRERQLPPADRRGHLRRDQALPALTRNYASARRTPVSAPPALPPQRAHIGMEVQLDRVRGEAT